MPNYVSRAGVKLEHALAEFQVNVEGKICMDVGAATGGFTDCLLQQGAAKVFTIETGYGALDWKLRNDPRVVVKERTNILYELELPEKVDVAVVDTSWTRLKLSVPATSRFTKTDAIILALLKPQYEVAKKDLVKGIVKPEALEGIVKSVRQDLQDLGFVVSEAIDSPITGEAGNKEFWLKVVLK
jgi:23S rRNA (cytidine1920-2'-O)/16S rRNA (cytidine1409-2'-O)-methyltransferase